MAVNTLQGARRDELPKRAPLVAIPRYQLDRAS
jgi:hypothetical protein